MKLYILQPRSKWQNQNYRFCQTNVLSYIVCVFLHGNNLGFCAWILNRSLHCLTITFCRVSWNLFYSENSPSQIVLQKPKTNDLSKNFILHFLIFFNLEIPLQRDLLPKQFVSHSNPIWYFFFLFEDQYRWFYLCTLCAPFHSILFA